MSPALDLFSLRILAVRPTISATFGLILFRAIYESIAALSLLPRN